MLFSPFTIKDLSLKNRIVMSPMSMYACKDETGIVQDWHRIHYPARAIGGVGLVMVECSAVTLQGRMSPQDLGIWGDEHIDGLKSLVALVKTAGAAVGIQISHAGRKAKIDGPIVAPSAISFKEGEKTPEELSITQIENIVQEFKEAAARVRKAEFDVLEIHAAHGYLINEFLSPVTNQRQDEYGGTVEKRFRLLKEIIESVKTEWNGPLFVRVSADEFDTEGNSLDHYIYYSRLMKEMGVDLIDVSAGGLINFRPKTYPGYQVPLADAIRNAADVPTGAVGLIKQAGHAEEILRNKRADLIFLGRELLWNPHWAYAAAQELGVVLELPQSYSWSWIKKL